MKSQQYLTERLIKLSGLLHRYEMHIRRERGDPYGNPHRGQGRVLALLKMQPEISQKDLSFLLDMRAQSLGELLTKLERNGLITRTPSEEDRRAQIIHLTKEGENAASRVQTSPEGQDLFHGFSQEERAAFSGYLDRLITELESRIGDEEMRGRPMRHEDDRRRGSRGEHGPEGEYGPRGGRGRGPDGHGHPHDGRHGRPDFDADEDPRLYREFLWEDEDIDKR